MAAATAAAAASAAASATNLNETLSLDLFAQAIPTEWMTWEAIQRDFRVASFLQLTGPSDPWTLGGWMHWYTTHPSVNQFSFTVGETPLSTWATPILAVPLYLLTIVLLKKIVRARGSPFPLTNVFVLHNFALSALSAVLFVALVADIGALMVQHGFWAVFCDEQHSLTSGRQHYLYYLNYLTKFVELLDTFLLVLRGKPLQFLHVYHHAATFLLCFTQLRARSCVQFVPIIINLGIHVVMYYYYAVSTLKIKVWWKSYITKAQILQFIVGLIACFVALGSLVMWHIDPTHPFAHQCSGKLVPSFFGVGILLSYLLLFIQLYFTMYHSDKKASKGKVE